MFEARLLQGKILKQIVESIKELVEDGNLDCNDGGISIQAMDSSHVSLCAVKVRADGFDNYRCDRAQSLGINMANIAKLLKCGGADDAITLRAHDNAETLIQMFESDTQDRVSDFELKLMNIDAEHLGIPDTEYTCSVSMPSSEFQRIVKDLQAIGETCTISVNKNGVKFSVAGDLGAGNITVRENNAVDKEEDRVEIRMDEPVALTFALKFLASFTKATPLGNRVHISMSPDIPVVVEYPIGEIGYVKFFLAPKIVDEEDE